MLIYECEIDGVMPYIYLKLINDSIIVEKTIPINNSFDNFGFAIVARKQYNENLKFTEFGNLLKYDDNKANCYINCSENYPRSNPNEISLIYEIYPLRLINEGLLLFAKPYDFTNNQNKRIASSLLRLKPDYKSLTTLDKMKKIVTLLYEESDSVSKIVEDLYNMQVTNASKYF